MTSTELAPLSIDIGRVTPVMAEKLCREKPEMAAQLIMALATQNTAMLPGTAFVRRSDGQTLVKQRMSIVLRESSGDLTPMPAKKVVEYDDNNRKKETWLNRWSMSHQGVRRCNEAASLQIIRPETVTVEGRKQMNPYIHVDPDTKMVDVCYARCLAVGYSPNGSLVATDATIRLDVNLYLLENIQAKMKELGDNSMKLGIYGTSGERPVDDKGDPLPGRWTFLPIHSHGLGLWVNNAHHLMTKVWADHTTRCKFLERLAQSFAERNALKSHPAIPSRVEAENGIATVTVYGWTTDFNRADIDRLRAMIEQDRLHEYEDPRNPEGKVNVVSVVEQDEEEAAAAVNEAMAEERSQEGVSSSDDEEADEGSGSDPAPPDRDLRARSIDCFTELGIAMGTKRAIEVARECGLEHVEEGTAEQYRAFIARVDELMT